MSERLVVDGVEAKSTAFANLETRLLIDTQDSGALPSRGTHLSSALGYSVRNYSYPYFDTAVSKFVPLKNGAGIFVLGHGATSFGRKLPFYDQFTAGGIADLPAYRLQDFHANTMGIAGAGAYAWLPKLHTSNWRPVLAVWHEVGRFDLGSLGWETHQSSSIGIFGPSPLGPVGIALSATEDGKLKFRLVSGRF